jgi:hypothetical protein
MTTQLDILDGIDGAEHPPEGVLQSHLDGELAGSMAAEVATHLAECAFCRSESERLASRSLRVSELLEGVGEVIRRGDRAAIEQARWDIRRRRAAGRGHGLRRRSAAAAVILVVAAGGVAAALPGSPLRSLFSGETGGVPALSSGGTTAPAPASEAPPGSAGVALAFRDGRVDVVLSGAAPGLAVEIEVGEGDRVEVLAPEEARFEAGSGSVVVDLAGVSASRAEAQGILVRIPAGPGQVVVRSGARYLVEWTAGSFRFGEGVSADPRSSGVRVRVPDDPDGRENP